MGWMVTEQHPSAVAIKQIPSRPLEHSQEFLGLHNHDTYHHHPQSREEAVGQGIQNRGETTKKMRRKQRQGGRWRVRNDHGNDER
jgi:hypothetical protein